MSPILREVQREQEKAAAPRKSGIAYRSRLIEAGFNQIGTHTLASWQRLDVLLNATMEQNMAGLAPNSDETTEFTRLTVVMNDA